MDHRGVSGIKSKIRDGTIIRKLIFLLFRNRRCQQCIDQIRRRSVKDPVRHLLQRHPGADNRKSPGTVLNSQGPERDARGILAVFLPFGPPAQEPVPDGILRDLNRDRPAGTLQLVHHHISVRRHGMAGQVPRRGDRDLPVPALVQVGGPDIRVI